MNRQILSLGDLIDNYPLDNGFYSVHKRDHATNVIKDITELPQEDILNAVDNPSLMVFTKTEGVITWLTNKPSNYNMASFVMGDVVDEMLSVN